MFLDGLTIFAMPVLVYYITCLCVTGMANIIIVLILDCIATISHCTALVVIASTLDSTSWSTNPFSMMSKGGRYEYDLVLISLPSLVDSLTLVFSYVGWITCLVI